MHANIRAMAVTAVLAAASLWANPATAGDRYGGSRHTASATYRVGTTTYRMAQYYSTGVPKVQRSDAVRREFLLGQGYTGTPRGYEVDHIVPLSRGGADAAYNMELLSTEVHHAKTRAERSR